MRRGGLLGAVVPGYICPRLLLSAIVCNAFSGLNQLFFSKLPDVGTVRTRQFGHGAAAADPILPPSAPAGAQYKKPSNDSGTSSGQLSRSCRPVSG